MKNVLITIGVAVGVVVVYRMFLAAPPGPTSGTTQTVDPTLAGVAGIVGATSGLVKSIGGLFGKGEASPDEDASSERRAPPLGMTEIRAPAFGRQASAPSIASGFALYG